MDGLYLYMENKKLSKDTMLSIIKERLSNNYGDAKKMLYNYLSKYPSTFYELDQWFELDAFDTELEQLSYYVQVWSEGVHDIYRCYGVSNNILENIYISLNKILKNGHDDD